MRQLLWSSACILGLCSVSAFTMAGGIETKATNRLIAVDTVKVSGSLHVFLRSAKHTGHISFKGKGASHVIKQVRGHVLTLIAPQYEGASYPARAIVSLPKPLRRVVALSGAQVIGRHLATSQLSVAMSGVSMVDLGGIVDLESADLLGDSNLYLEWVKSPRLTLRQGGVSVVHLAGKVRSLDAKLMGRSTMYGQYLNAKTAFVSTHDNAMAYVSPLDNLRAFAAGRSNIYYFTAPKHQTDLPDRHGNILFVGSSHDPWGNMNRFFKYHEQLVSKKKTKKHKKP